MLYYLFWIMILVFFQNKTKMVFREWCCKDLITIWFSTTYFSPYSIFTTYALQPVLVKDFWLFNIFIYIFKKLWLFGTLFFPRLGHHLVIGVQRWSTDLWYHLFYSHFWSMILVWNASSDANCIQLLTTQLSTISFLNEFSQNY